MRRITPVTLGVVAIALATGTVATAVTLMSGSTGTTVAGQGLSSAGAMVEVLPGATTSLSTGELVVGFAGRSLEQWASDLFDAGAQRPSFSIGTDVPFEVVAGSTGAAETVVTTIAYPLLPVLLSNVGVLAFVVALAAVSGYVFWRRPRDEAAAALLLAATGALASTVPWLLGLDPLDFATGAFWLEYAAVSVVYLLLWSGALHFALAFPRRPQFLERHPRLVVAPYLAIYGAYGAGIALTAPGATDTLDWLASWNAVQLVIVIVSLLVTIVAMAAGWRRADADDRRALRWFALTGAFAAIGTLSIYFVPELVIGRPLVPWNLDGLLGIPVPMALGVAILRHQAFGIEVALRRTVVYGGLTLGIVAVYAVTVAVLGAVLGAGSDFAVRLLATGAAALAALPLRDAFQRIVDRIIYGDRDQPVRAITRLGERLSWAVDPSAGLAIVAETVAEALRLPYVAVEVVEPGGARIMAAHGEAVAAESLPLVYAGETQGRLIVAPRTGQAGFEAADRQLLEGLAQQAGPAVHAMRLTTDLQHSREELVTAREEERRRLRRDLHDGLGPALAGIAMRAEAAQALVTVDPDEASRMLTAVGDEARAALADIRRLVYALRPPALDELGLAGAIRQQAERIGPTGPVVSVEVADPLPELPAAVEVAAYRIAVEALANVANHAQARSCEVRIAERDGLLIEVDDDGVGLPAGTPSGVGLTSMRERAAELGGRLSIHAEPGRGTRVQAWLPL